MAGITVVYTHLGNDFIRIYSIRWMAKPVIETTRVGKYRLTHQYYSFGDNDVVSGDKNDCVSSKTTFTAAHV